MLPERCVFGFIEMAAPLKIVAIWNALHKHAHSRGGEIISVPNRFPVTIVCNPDSVLAHELTRMAITFSRLMMTLVVDGTEIARVSTPAVTVPETITLIVQKGQPREWINPIGLVTEIRARSSAPSLRRETHVRFDTVTEFTVDLKRTS
jgi:hypothetical protein